MGCMLSTKFKSHPTRRSSTTASDASVAAVGTSLVTITRSPGDPLGWPPWLLTFAGEALSGLTPRRADSFKKLSKVLLSFPKVQRGKLYSCGVHNSVIQFHASASLLSSCGPRNDSTVLVKEIEKWCEIWNLCCGERMWVSGWTVERLLIRLLTLVCCIII